MHHHNVLTLIFLDTTSKQAFQLNPKATFICKVVYIIQELHSYKKALNIVYITSKTS